MKEKIIIFVIGLLVGAIIASGAFLIYTKTSSTNCETQTIQMNGGTPPEMPNGENGQPPEKPDGENSNSSENSKKSKKSNSGSTTNSESTEKSDSKTKENN
ncbi:MAG: hypothetical protein IJR82_01960 [Bacilli bacterium]|nr:hypothetical protein [Bacilli bacterium]